MSANIANIGIDSLVCTPSGRYAVKNPQKSTKAVRTHTALCFYYSTPTTILDIGILLQCSTMSVASATEQVVET